jgi:acetate kinase
MMGTRAGSVDPGLLLYLERRKGLSTEQLENILNHESGLLGVSGVSSDFRAVERAAGDGNERARLALEIYAGRIRSAIGALAATLGRLDAVIFTAGVGEHAAALRADVCRGLECLGLKLDQRKNAANPVDADVATPDSRVRVLLIHTREEQVVAREARRLAAVATSA